MNGILPSTPNYLVLPPSMSAVLQILDKTESVERGGRRTT